MSVPKFIRIDARNFELVRRYEVGGVVFVGRSRVSGVRVTSKRMRWTANQVVTLQGAPQGSALIERTYKADAKADGLRSLEALLTYHMRGHGVTCWADLERYRSAMASGIRARDR